MNEILSRWEDVTNELIGSFIKRYFGKLEEVEYYWIAEDVGGVLSVADYFFNLGDIVDFIKYHYSKDLMFEYYDYALEYHMQKKHKSTDYLINIKNYKKLMSCQKKKSLKENPITKSSNSKNKRKLT
jgi:hypothetical protein